MFRRKISWFSFCLALLILVFSCHITKQEFGEELIQSNTDSIGIQKAIVAIRAISYDVFEAHSYKGSDQIEIQYRLVKPLHEKKKAPLVVVFHGSNAIGNDNTNQMGLLSKMWALPGLREKYPAYVLAPQFSSRSSNYVIDNARGVLTSQPQQCIYSVLALIDSLKQVLNIDGDRIYAVGFSMGGSTVINALSLRPELFAAGISIAGIPQFDHIDSLSKIPIWLIHGNADTENPIDSDILFFKELNVHGNARFTILDGVGHDKVLMTEIIGVDLIKWMFEKR